MEDSKKGEMLERINTEIGFDITDKEAWKSITLSDEEAHERDNAPSPLYTVRFWWTS